MTTLESWGRTAAVLAAALAGACGSVVSGTPDGDAGDDGGRRDDGRVDTSEDGATEETEEEAEDGEPPDDGGEPEEAEPGDGGPEDGADVPPGCGNGIPEPELGEECDDGNEREGDGCEPDCTWTCEGAEECVDGNACDGTEECADHVCIEGARPADGTECLTELGETGSCRDGECVPSQCPNGVTEPGEECDDGNAEPGDGCEPDCTWTCEDDGDCDDTKACNGTEGCRLPAHVCEAGTPPEDGTTCRTPDSRSGVCHDGLCVPTGCGNGVPEPAYGEECDDGNTDNDDACLADCRNATCGDGFVWEGEEECEPPMTHACTASCGTGGTYECVGCRWTADCIPPLEVCNGEDDDCDDACDDAFTCCAGESLGGSDGSCTFTVTCDSTCGWGENDYGDPPANDACTASPPAAIPETLGVVQTFGGSTCAAADDYAPPVGPGMCTTASSARDVVYKLVLSAARVVTLSTEGSTFDTVLHLWRQGGATCPGTLLACNDDYPGALTSRLDKVLPAGTYWVVVDGFGSLRGTYALSVKIEEAAVNDECAGAIPLTASNYPQIIEGDTSRATDDGAACGTASTTPGPDVWFSIDPGLGRRILYFDIIDGEPWAGALRVYEGDCAASAEIACTRDACGTRRARWAGVVGRDGVGSTYYVAVDGQSAASAGPFVLRWQVAPHDCARGTAGAIAEDGTFRGSFGAGVLSRTDGSCMTGLHGPEAFYYVPLCQYRTVTATTCDAGTTVDTALYLRANGCGLGAGVGDEFTCNSAPGGCPTPEGTTINFGDFLGPGLFFLFVDSEEAVGTAGDYVLRVTGL